MFHQRIAIAGGSILARSFIVGAAAAMTASTAMASPDCKTMIRSFDQVVVEGGTAAKVAAAKKSRKAGAAALASGKEKACLKHLVQAHATISQAQSTMAIEEPDTAQ